MLALDGMVSSAKNATMQHKPTQWEKIQAWQILQRTFKPEKAARLLGSRKKDLTALELKFFPPKPKKTLQERVFDMEKFFELTSSGTSGNTAAAIIGRPPSWFSKMAPIYRRLGPEGLMFAREKNKLKPPPADA